MNKMGFCITGSFCSMDDMLEVLKKVSQNFDIVGIVLINIST